MGYGHVQYDRNLSVPSRCGQLYQVVELQGWPTSQALQDLIQRRLTLTNR